MMLRWNKENFINNYTERPCKKIKFCGDHVEEIMYSDNIFCFDIEVSSGWLMDDGETVIGYDKNFSDEWYSVHKAVSLPYIWMFGFNDTIYYGRDLQEFSEVLETINDITKEIKILFIHNFAYEFQILQNILKFKDVFGRSMRKPMRAGVEGLDQIEIRCSYTLTNMSLATWGESIGLPKAVGDLNYKLFRTPLSDLDETELGYCERDIEVMYKGISEVYLKRWGHLFDIPMTQTGEVRRTVKKMTKKIDRMKITNMLPVSVEEYRMLINLFCGGDTHANAKYSGKVFFSNKYKGTTKIKKLHKIIDEVGLIESEDFTSSYPAVLISEKFPMTRFRKISPSFFKENDDKNCYGLKVKFTNICSNYNNSYLSSSRCGVLHNGQMENATIDNGRIVDADELVVWLTDVDFQDMKKAYSYQSYQIMECWVAKKDYLPEYMVKAVLDFYEKKTTLKGVVGKEDEYAFFKQMLNSLYGMCVTALLSEPVEYEEGIWSHGKITYEDVAAALEKIHTNSNKNFLNYGWGVWCTSFARHNLWTGIFEMDEDVLYYDTDSLKHLNHEKYLSYFEEYNKNITEKINRVLDIYGIDHKRACPLDIKGIEHPLGVWDFDGQYTEFRTLGAKRYIYRAKKDGQLHITVSGVKKSAVKILKDNILNFKDGFVFDRDKIDEIDAGKNILTYIDGDMPEFEYKGYKSSFKYGIAMKPVGYSMNVGKDYLIYLDYLLSK